MDTKWEKGAGAKMATGRKKVLLEHFPKPTLERPTTAAQHVGAKNHENRKNINGDLFFGFFSCCKRKRIPRNIFRTVLFALCENFTVCENLRRKNARIAKIQLGQFWICFCGVRENLLLGSFFFIPENI